MYLQVRLDLTGPAVDLGSLAGMDLEVMKVDEEALTLAVRQPVLQELLDLGYQVSIEIEDMMAFYASRLRMRFDREHGR